jgi:hypothetical protein
MARITGRIELGGTVTEFSIEEGLGWQQWGSGTTEQLSERVEIIEALVAGLAGEGIMLDEDEEG